MPNRIEIPAVGLLDKHRALVTEFRTLAKTLAHFSVGWSYYLEWAWMFGQLSGESLAGKKVLDAGAGMGLSQWYLAELGADVYSVDRQSRACLPLYLRRRYKVVGLRDSDLLTLGQLLNPFDRTAGLGKKAGGVFRSCKAVLARPRAGRAPGTVHMYNQDLVALRDIPDDSIDLVVSTSALEHNPPAVLAAVVDELLRVLKPGARLIATLAAAPGQDSFHGPSSSWCYTDRSLRQLFKLGADAPSNYPQYSALMQAVRDSHELGSGLSYHYYFGGHNGMPWGQWNPAFLPVGVIKEKERADGNARLSRRP